MSDLKLGQLITTFTQIIAKAMRLDSLAESPQSFTQPQRCVITGEVITEGYSVQSLFGDASGVMLDTVVMPHTGVVSTSAAQVHRNAWNLGSRVFTESGAHYRPLVSLKSAIEQERPCWRNLVRELPVKHAGEQVVIILTDDFKKRHWHLCRAGEIEYATPIFVHSGEHVTSGLLTVNWSLMLETLDLLETIYARGFSLRALRTSLLSETKAIHAAGLASAVKLEKQLAQLRGTPEFIIAHIVTQKEK